MADSSAPQFPTTRSDKDLIMSKTPTLVVEALLVNVLYLALTN